MYPRQLTARIRHLTRRFGQLPRAARRAIRGGILLIFASLALAPGLLYRDSVAASDAAAQPAIAMESPVATASAPALIADLPSLPLADAAPVAPQPGAPAPEPVQPAAPATPAGHAAPSAALPSAAPTLGMLAASGGFGHGRSRGFGGTAALASVDGGVSAAPQMRVPERTIPTETESAESESAAPEAETASTEESTQPEQIADSGESAVDKNPDSETAGDENNGAESSGVENIDTDSSALDDKDGGSSGDDSTPVDDGYTELALLDGPADNTAPRPVVAVPEPSSLALVAGGIAALIFTRRKQRA
jgi:hypothetical protein